MEPKLVADFSFFEVPNDNFGDLSGEGLFC
jgi:hypothetical protein